MIQFPKKLRPPQMWWVIEQQARRRRARAETPAVSVAWAPEDAWAYWTAGGVDGEGDLNAFSLLDPASVEWLSLSYNALTAVSGLESLTSLEYLELYYTTEPFAVTALPASLATLSAPYSGITSLPDLTTTPNLTWLNLHYSNYLEGEPEMKLAMLQQLDANGKSGGFVDIGNFDTGTPGAVAVITSLTGKGWSINV